jgi:hypothetical protein
MRLSANKAQLMLDTRQTNYRRLAISRGVRWSATYGMDDCGSWDVRVGAQSSTRSLYVKVVPLGKQLVPINAPQGSPPAPSYAVKRFDRDAIIVSA